MESTTPAWHVDAPGIEQTTTLGPGSTGLVTSWKVPYVIDSGPAEGSRHTVLVAPEKFHADGVKAAIAGHAAAVHAVASLSS